MGHRRGRGAGEVRLPARRLQVRRARRTAASPFGWDRIVALLAGTDSIRDVIAFPKSGGGFDPLTAAPAPITPEQRKEAGVDAPTGGGRPGRRLHRLRVRTSVRDRIRYTRPVIVPAVPTASRVARRPPLGRDAEVARTDVRLDGGEHVVDTTSPETRAGTSDDLHRRAERPEGQGDRRPVADADRVRSAAAGQDRRRSARHRHLLHAGRGLRGPDRQACSGSRPSPVQASERGRPGRPGYRSTGPPLPRLRPEHPFGIAPRTGDDNLAYWIYGCRTSLIIAGAGDVLRLLIGIVIGLVAGFVGGVVDRIISFITDLFLTIPFLLAALTIAPIIIDRFGTRPDSSTTSQICSLIGDPGRCSAGWRWPA